MTTASTDRRIRRLGQDTWIVLVDGRSIGEIRQRTEPGLNDRGPRTTIRSYAPDGWHSIPANDIKHAGCMLAVHDDQQRVDHPLNLRPESDGTYTVLLNSRPIGTIYLRGDGRAYAKRVDDTHLLSAPSLGGGPRAFDNHVAAATALRAEAQR